MTDMNVDEYQATTKRTAVYPGVGTGTRDAVTYCVLGLAGETGELVEIVKKIHRGDFDGCPYHVANPAVIDDNCIDCANVENKLLDRLKAELGDVAWYWHRLCDELELPASQVLRGNLKKLNDRLIRGVIHGSGDDR